MEICFEIMQYTHFLIRPKVINTFNLPLAEDKVDKYKLRYKYQIHKFNC